MIREGLARIVYGKTKREETAMVFPALIVVAAVAAFPLIYAAYHSVHNLNLLFPTSGTFVGLENFVSVLSRPDFWNSVRVTITLTATVVSLELLLGLSVAMVLARKFRGARMLRTILAVPVMMAPLAAGIIWLLIFNHSFGVLNFLITSLGLEAPLWLGRAPTAFAAVAISDLWRATPFMLLVLIAGLQSIPVQLYESAAIDGAGRVRAFFHVTLPGLTRFIFVGVVFRTIDALRMYDEVFVLTGGGPNRATETLSIYLYRYGFSEYAMGFTSAAALIFLAIVVAVTLPLVLSATRRE